MKRIVIKEGPIVFLRNVVVMEILAALFFLGISYLTNYEQAYGSFGLPNFLTYNYFLMIAFSGFQIVYILGLFFDWYFKFFEIREKEIVRRSGFLFKRQKSVSLRQVATVEISQSPLDRITKHATLVLEHNNGRSTKIRNVPDFAECAALIKQMIENSAQKSLQNHSLPMLLKSGEGLFVEYKQTLRYDIRKKCVSKDVEHSVAKTIAGFMNSDGGVLVIGVDDDGVVTGLNHDYETLAKKNRDGFENHLNMLIKSMVGIKFASFVRAKFDHFDGKEACLVHVEPSHKPAYLQNPGGKEEFYVRTGNSTQPFSMSEAEEYIKNRWK